MRLLLWLLVALAIVGSAAIWVVRSGPITPENATTSAAQASFGGPFTLVGGDGKPFSSAKLNGRPIGNLGDGVWHHPYLAHALHQVVSDRQRSAELTLEGDSLPGRWLKAGLSVRRFESEEGGTEMLLLVVHHLEEAAGA